jgi:polar amino acid transport system substrate-binding protein
MNQRYVIPIILLIFAGIFLSFSYFHPHFDSSLTRCIDQGYIIIGYSIEPPYAYIDNSEITGESPEVAREIVRRLGISNITWRQTEFGSLISELEAGKIDVIASGMFITEARKEQIAFSLPSIHVLQGLLVKKGNPHNIHSYRQAFQNKDVSIAVLSGSVEELIFRELGMSEDRLIHVPDAISGLASVETGKIDGFALSSPPIRWIEKHNPSRMVEQAYPFDQTDISKSIISGNGAFGFRKSDKKLLDAWNDQMILYIGSEEHQELVRRFGIMKEELPDYHTQQNGSEKTLL